MIYLNGIHAQRRVVTAPDYALDFDNISYDEYVDMGTSYLTNTRTISLRVKLDTTTFNGQSRNFICGQYGGSGQRTTYLEFNTSGLISVYIPTATTGNNNATIVSNAGVFFNADQWYYISVVMTGTRAEMYIDNTLQSNTFNVTNAFTRSGGPFTLGALSSSYISLGGTATIQDVSVWNDARTQSELLADETRIFTGSEAGLKGHWSMDEGSGTTITDTSGTQINTITSNNSVAAMWETL